MNGCVECGGPASADLVRVDDLLGLVHGRARRLEIAGGDRDLDLRGKAAEPVERLGCLLERSADPGDCGVHLALGEPDEREPRLRLAPELVRDAVRVLGSRQVTTTPPDLADLVVPGSRDHLMEVLQLFGCGERLRLRRRPSRLEVAWPLHDGSGRRPGSR